MRRANILDKDHVIQILTRAFSDNKSVNYVIKQDKKKEERLKFLMEYSFEVCYAFGEVWLSNDSHAAALILFPHKKRASLRTILWDVKLALSVVGIDRVSRVLRRESLIKRNHPKEPFAYLWFIGVNPTEQNKGIGSVFISEVIQECQQKKLPIYLETSTLKNIPFYKKFGFEIFESLDLDYTLYQLRRV
jgi:GNAT superfamily N-acetyltransferase